MTRTTEESLIYKCMYKFNSLKSGWFNWIWNFRTKGLFNILFEENILFWHMHILSHTALIPSSLRCTNHKVPFKFVPERHSYSPLYCTLIVFFIWCSNWSEKDKAGFELCPLMLIASVSEVNENYLSRSSTLRIQVPLHL